MWFCWVCWCFVLWEVTYKEEKQFPSALLFPLYFFCVLEELGRCFVLFCFVEDVHWWMSMLALFHFMLRYGVSIAVLLPSVKLR